MKKMLSPIMVLILVVSLALSFVAPVFAAQPSSNASTLPNGVDQFRGAWGGTITLPGKLARQINIYFNKSVLDTNNPQYYKASGYFSNDKLGGQKRAKATQLPMMASYKEVSAGRFEIVILATFQIPPELGSGTTVLKLVGQASMGGPGLSDDVMSGTWYAKDPQGNVSQGPWSATLHLDRRNVTAPPVDLNDPTLHLWFNVDVYAGLDGPGTLPPEQRNPSTILGCMSNIVMDSVRVACPNGKLLIIPPYTDVFSPGVDWVTLFRFNTSPPGLPVAGGKYTFTALDVAGDPIPGVKATDVWVGVQPPDPPTNVQASITAGGIMVTWDNVPVIPGSFDPTSGLGFYQLELRRIQPDVLEVYGANGIAYPFHLIPKDKNAFVLGQDHGLSLSELSDGTYSLRTCVHSVAPQGSAGHGFEYNNADPGQTIFFKIENGVVTWDISGTWLFNIIPQGQAGNELDCVYIQQQVGTYVYYTLWQHEYAISVHGTINGNNLELSGAGIYYGENISYSASATTDGKSIVGSYSYTGASNESGTWTAQRCECKKAKAWVRQCQVQNRGYYLDFDVWDLIPEGITFVSAEVSGPHIGTVSMHSTGPTEYFPWAYSQSLGETKPTTGDVYTFTVTYSDGSSDTVSASVRETFVDFPTLITPSDGETVNTLSPTFSWLPPTCGCQGYYRIWVVDDTGNDMWSQYLSKDTTSAVYNFDGSGAPLIPGETYECRLVAFDQPILGGPDNNVWVIASFTVQTP